jgi:hypothetical protein
MLNLNRHINGINRRLQDSLEGINRMLPRITTSMPTIEELANESDESRSESGSDASRIARMVEGDGRQRSGAMYLRVP